MNKLRNYSAVTAALAILFVVALSGVAHGQSGSSKKADSTETPTVNAPDPRTVDARQSGAWIVGINPAENTVRLPNSPTNPLPVKVIESGSARKAFQARVSVLPTGLGFSSASLPIPAGKRLVIENVSAVGRCPEGIRMEINFFSYLDNNSDGIVGNEDLTFHRIALTDQGAFGGATIFAANHKVLVFADEQIGTQRLQINVQARLNGTATGTGTIQAQVTFSGYLEDLPTVP